MDNSPWKLRVSKHMSYVTARYSPKDESNTHKPKKIVY